MIRTAVIGLGAMGRNHLRIYQEMEAVDLVAVCDVDPELANRLGRRLGVRAYTDYRELLRRERPQAVSVAVPTSLHAPVASQSLESGAHVLLEKPIAATLEEAEHIVACARRSGVGLGIGHVERFNPAVTELKRRLAQGELGHIFLIEARRMGPFPPRVRDVGVVIDLASHDLDIMLYLTEARVERVHAETQRRIHTEHEDLLAAILKFDNGVIGALEVNWITPTKIRELAVTGERGMFVVNYLTQDLFFYENNYAKLEWDGMGTLLGVSEGNMTRIAVAKREPLQAELEDFVAAVQQGRSPLITGEEGVATLALAHRLVAEGQHDQQPQEPQGRAR